MAMFLCHHPRGESSLENYIDWMYKWMALVAGHRSPHASRSVIMVERCCIYRVNDNESHGAVQRGLDVMDSCIVGALCGVMAMSMTVIERLIH